MARSFDPARHPRDRFGRFTKSRTVKASAKDKAAARAVAEGFTPRQVSGGERQAYLRKIAGSDQAGQQFAGLVEANKALRAGKDSPTAAELDKAMVVLPDDVLLSRRVPVSAFGTTDPQSLAGMKVRDAGFAPAQLGTVAAADGQVRMHLAVPAGTRAAVNPGTGEVVLDRDTEMVVARVDRNSAGGHDMYLTVLPKTTSPAADVPADDGDTVRADLMKLKVPQLRARMRERGLTAGRMRKTQMVDALIADETGGKPATPDRGTQGSPDTAGGAEDQVRSTVADIIREDGGRDGDWVSITRLRAQLADLSKAEFDTAIRALHRQPGVNVEGRPDRWALNQADHDAAVTIAGEPRHLIAIQPARETTRTVGVASDDSPAGALSAAPLGLDRPGGSDQLTSKMRRHLAAYRKGSDGAINTALRSTGQPAAVEQRNQITGIDQAMAASHLTREVRVFRGVRQPQVMFGERMQGDLTGMVWREDAYVSSSAVEKVAQAFTQDRTDPAAVGLIMHITVPEGVGAVELSPSTFEGELLLDRGHQFQVTADRGVVGGARVVDVAVLPKAVTA